MTRSIACACDAGGMSRLGDRPGGDVISTGCRSDGNGNEPDRQHRSRCGSLERELIALRRTIHAHPSSRSRSTKPPARAGIPHRLGIPFPTGIGGTGIVAMLQGAKAGTDHRDPRRHGRAADERALRPAVRIEGPGQDAFVRPRRAHDDCAGVAAVLSDSATTRRPRDVHLPARRGNAVRREGDAGRRRVRRKSPTPFSASTTGRRSPRAPSVGTRRR